VTNATLPSNLNTLFITGSPFLSPRGSPHRNLFRCSSGRNREHHVVSGHLRFFVKNSVSLSNGMMFT